MFHFHRGLFALALATCSRLAYGASPALTLDVERYVALVHQNHPGSTIAPSRRAEAEAERLSARLLPDPTLEIGVGRGKTTGPEPGAARGERAYSIRQTLPWPNALAASVRAADRGADASEAKGLRASWELESEARQTFFRLLGAREIIGAFRSAEGDARSLRDLVARRVEVGEARESDRAKAEVEWLKQRLLLIAAERDAEAAERAVRVLAAIPASDPLALDGELPDAGRGPSAVDVGTRAFEANPDLLAARAEAERDSLLFEGAKWSRVPDLELSIFRNREIDKKSDGFALGFRLPLWNANRGEVAKARAQASLASAEAGRVEFTLRIELESRLRTLDLARARTGSLRKEILPAAHESQRIARLLFEEGETSLLDLIDASRTLREAVREEIEARLEFSAALVELGRLVGPEIAFPKEPKDRNPKP